MNPNGPSSDTHRRIKSFVLRQGRLTQAQDQALRELWPHYGLDAQQPLDPLKTFGRTAPLTLEIGFGNGQSLARMATEAPERDFIGIEVHRPGVGHLLLELNERQLSNVRIYCADAVEVMNRAIADASLDGLQIFFPDPWPKKKHHKRRLINEEFAALAARKLATGGKLHCATDWEDYALQMLDVLGRSPDLRNLAGQGEFSPRPEYRPLTKFESRGQRLGHGVWDLLFVRSGPAG